MRHRNKVNPLSRTASHRKAMFSNMATSLILHKRIVTTTAKAKALRRFVEPILTKSKTDTTHNRRLTFSVLRDKAAVKELFATVAPAIAERPGGYTRVLKVGFRQGDAAEMALIELVDFNEFGYTQNTGAGKKKKRRRGGKKKKDSTVQVPTEVTAVAAEAPAAAPEAIDEAAAEASAAAEGAETVEAGAPSPELAEEVTAAPVAEVAQEAVQEEETPETSDAPAAEPAGEGEVPPPAEEEKPADA